jgi:hypothetical protein
MKEQGRMPDRRQCNNFHCRNSKGSVLRGGRRGGSGGTFQWCLAIHRAARHCRRHHWAHFLFLIGGTVDVFILQGLVRNMVFVITRRTERGPVERAIVQKLDELRPHLARSAFLSARLQLEQARIASETLAILGLPGLVFDNQP